MTTILTGLVIVSVVTIFVTAAYFCAVALYHSIKKNLE